MIQSEFNCDFANGTIPLNGRPALVFGRAYPGLRLVLRDSPCRLIFKDLKGCKKKRRTGQRRPNKTPQQLPAVPINLAQRKGKFLKYGFGFPSPNHSFTTTAEFPHILLFVLRHGGITCSNAAALRCINISFRNLIDAWLLAAVHTPHLVSKPNPDEKEISGERVAHMCILALRANLIPGNIIRALGPSVAGYDRMLIWL